MRKKVIIETTRIVCDRCFKECDRIFFTFTCGKMVEKIEIHICGDCYLALEKQQKEN